MAVLQVDIEGFEGVSPCLTLPSISGLWRSSVGMFRNGLLYAAPKKESRRTCPLEDCLGSLAQAQEFIQGSLASAKDVGLGLGV